MLFNSEVWYNVTEDDIQKLSEVDEYLMRKILELPSKTPIESLYLETGSIPIKFYLKKRRLMYLKHILSRKENELIKRFYLAQKSQPSKNDWVNTIKNDLKDCNINITDEEIEKITKYKYKKMIKKAISNDAFRYLMNKKVKHSKMEDIQ